MSLLNQVLIDLEKRNTKNTPEQQPLNNIKTPPLTQKKPYYLLLAFILFASIAGIIFYHLKEPEKQVKTISSSLKKIASLTLPEEKPVITFPTAIAQDIQVTKPKVSTPVQKPKQKQKPKLAETKPAPASISTKPQKKIFKTFSHTQQAEQFFKSAKRQQNKSEKQRKLELALKLNPRHVNARLLLSNILNAQGLSIQTAELLDHGLAIFPQNLQFINLRSQLLLQNKQAQEALIVLQNIDESQVQNETYLSLLASAYQQNNNNLKSLQLYQQLLTINPLKAEYWLGLAIAAEKQGNTKQALKAYQEALNKNTLKSVIVSYIKQRISILK
ncbi:MAG: tetratricopeptide repeat protein [Methylococcaceae bacterium]